MTWRQGLDPSNPADQAIACEQVCGGLVCGAAPACVIGECHPPASGGSAQLVARASCDPSQPPPLARVTTVGDYHVTLDPSASGASYQAGNASATSSISGQVSLNLASSEGLNVVDFARSLITPSDFKLIGDDAPCQ